MGIRGLTTHIVQHQHMYMESYQLRDTTVILDGNSIALQLYNWHTQAWDCFGGDYDIYRRVVAQFFTALDHCHVVPIVIFDGGHEQRHLKKLHYRLKNRLDATITLLNVRAFPLGIREEFRDFVLDHGYQCYSSDFECDQDIATLARHLHCPLISYDSDFYIYPHICYIPFNTVEFAHTSHGYLPCKMFQVEKLLQNHHISITVLPLLALLLGNDYVNKSQFTHFYQQINPHQRNSDLITVTCDWLSHHNSLQSAISQLVNYYQKSRRYKLTQLIQSSISDYSNSSTQQLLTMTNDNLTLFNRNYRQCRYPACFMDIVHLNRYYCVPQVENLCEAHAHTLSLPIIAAICALLIGAEQSVSYWARDNRILKRFNVPTVHLELPHYEQIAALTETERKHLLYAICRISDEAQTVINAFQPLHLQLFIVTVIYCSPMKESTLCALFLLVILLNCVDNKVVGARRLKHVKSLVGEASELVHSTLDLYRVASKLIEQPNTCQKDVIHEYAQFQSCFLHVRYLNALLGQPFGNCRFSDIFSGTFLYNLTVDLRRRTLPPRQFIRTVLLPNCPHYCDLLDGYVTQILQCSSVQEEKLKRKKTRCKKRHPVGGRVKKDLVQTDDSDTTDLYDVNNRFTLLTLDAKASC